MEDGVVPFDRTRDGALSRRGALALGAGLVASVSAIAADTAVSETDIVIPTTDGSCDAALFHPTGDGRWPGVIIFTDALGLRPVFRDMGRRLAAEGCGDLRSVALAAFEHAHSAHLGHDGDLGAPRAA